MSENRSFRCEICHQHYCSKFTLSRHIKVKHTTKGSYIPCETCYKSLPNETLLSKHMETHHQLKNRLKCPLCSYLSHVSTKLNEHIAFHHGIDIEVETLKFESTEEFFKWKHAVEKNETSKFVKYCGNSRLKDGSIRSYYYCHRSYVQKPRVVNRMKKLKKQGLIKIGAHCPASIKTLKKRDGSVKVHYIKTHLGHEREMRYINLSKEERKYLASLISKNMSFDEILNDIKNQSDLIKSEKLKDVTKTDLHNIRRSFNLFKDTSFDSDRDDLIGADEWVKQQLVSNDCCVLYYKPKDLKIDSCLEENHLIKLPDNEFFLAIMTKDQETVLIRHEITCVCLDVIQSINLNEIRFELVSLCVLDSKKQEYPVAFLITTKADVQNVEIFLTLIRNKTGIITTKIFLCSMNESFFDVWCKLMKTPQVRFDCSWHVNRLWQSALQKINSPEEEIKTCEIITDLFEEKDKNVLDSKLVKVLDNLLTNKKTRRFGDYFQDTFVANVKKWAYCYRKEFGLETDIQLERIHRTLKYLFINVKTYKRLDKSVIEIKKFVQDKFFNKNFPPSNEFRISKMREIDTRHRASKRLNLESVIAVECGWKVNSKSLLYRTYTIQDVSPNCNCSLVCRPCRVCIHRFCCSCNDSSVMWQMCKHIHLLCRILDFPAPFKEIYNEQAVQQRNKENENISSDSELVNQFLQLDFSSGELDGLVESMCLSRPASCSAVDSIDQLKTNLKNKFSEMLEMIKTETEANLLDSSLDFLTATLSGKNNDSQDVFPPAEVFNETLPNYNNTSSLAYNNLSGPKVNTNNVSLNTQVAQNQYFTTKMNDLNDIIPPVPPLPPLVPLKSKKPTQYILLNQRHGICSPLTLKFLSMQQGNREPYKPPGNILILMNKTINSENG